MFTVHIQHSAELNELTHRYPAFSRLNGHRIPRDNKHVWCTTDPRWGYHKQETYNANVMFIGKTGYGKSTTLNKITGGPYFNTSDISACTKDLYNCMFRVDGGRHTFLSLNDLPGIGETNDIDKQYLKWYKEMLDKSDVVVYVLRADQRDFAVDQTIFENLLKGEEKKKVILAINCADKIEPIHRKGGLSKEQIENLERKRKEVSGIFNMPMDSILYYSAADEINLNRLINEIVEKVCRFCV